MYSKTVWGELFKCVLYLHLLSCNNCFLVLVMHFSTTITFLLQWLNTICSYFPLLLVGLDNKLSVLVILFVKKRKFHHGLHYLIQRSYLTFLCVGGWFEYKLAVPEATGCASSVCWGTSAYWLYRRACWLFAWWTAPPKLGSCSGKLNSILTLIFFCSGCILYVFLFSVLLVDLVNKKQTL